MKTTSSEWLFDRFNLPEKPLSAPERTILIEQVAALPAQLTAAARKAGGVKLQEVSLMSGCNGRQILHYVADVHLNFYQAFRRTLTEDCPTVSLLTSDISLLLPDMEATPVTVSLALLDALHTRWTILLWHLTEEQWQRNFFYSVEQQNFTLYQALVFTSKHGKHYLDLIENLS